MRKKRGKLEVKETIIGMDVSERAGEEEDRGDKMSF